MTSNHHTPIATGAARNASSVNTPLGDLDSAITENRIRSEAAKAVCNFRLTLFTGDPVPTTGGSAAGTLYFTPYRGRAIGLYDGASDWDILESAEVSIALAGLPAATPHDVFAYNNAGTLTLAFLAWASATARATALTTVDGIYVLSSNTTRRYVGTIYTDGAATTADSVTQRFVNNYYNQVPRLLKVTESVNSWTWATASWRQWNANTANKVEFVQGLAERPVELLVRGLLLSAFGSVGVGRDSTSVNVADLFPGGGVASGTHNVPLLAEYKSEDLGYHALNLLEYGNTGATFYGDGGVVYIQTGAIGHVWG